MKLIKRTIQKFNIGGKFIPKADGGLDFSTIYDFYNKQTEGGLNKKQANRLMKSWYGKGRSALENLYNQDLEAYNNMNNKLSSIYEDWDTWTPEMQNEYRNMYRRNPNNIGFTESTRINTDDNTSDYNEYSSTMNNLNALMGLPSTNEELSYRYRPSISETRQSLIADMQPNPSLMSNQEVLDAVRGRGIINGTIDATEPAIESTIDIEGPALTSMPQNTVRQRNFKKGYNSEKWNTQLANYNKILRDNGILEELTAEKLYDLQEQLGGLSVDGMLGQNSFNKLNEYYSKFLTDQGKTFNGGTWDDVAYKPSIAQDQGGVFGRNTGGSSGGNGNTSEKTPVKKYNLSTQQFTVTLPSGETITDTYQNLKNRFGPGSLKQLDDLILKNSSEYDDYVRSQGNPNFNYGGQEGNLKKQSTPQTTNIPQTTNSSSKPKLTSEMIQSYRNDGFSVQSISNSGTMTVNYKGKTYNVPSNLGSDPEKVKQYVKQQAGESSGAARSYHYNVGSRDMSGTPTRVYYNGKQVDLPSGVGRSDASIKSYLKKKFG